MEERMCGVHLHDTHTLRNQPAHGVAGGRIPEDIDPAAGNQPLWRHATVVQNPLVDLRRKPHHFRCDIVDQNRPVDPVPVHEIKEHC